MLEQTHDSGMCLQTKPPPDARIIKRREQEDRLSKIQSAVQV
jgi:hypothetical protein